MTATADLPNKKLVDFTEKSSFVDGDMSFILDSEDWYILKKINKTLMKWDNGEPWNQWDPWEDGNGIVSVTLISTVGKVKTYRILFTDATTYDFVVTDGADWTGSGDMVASTYDPNWLELPLQPQLNCVSKTANYTAQPSELVNCDISAGSFTVTLPSAPADKTIIYVKLNSIWANKYLTLACGGTDKFNTATGNTQIFMYLFGEYAQCQYCSTTWLWTTFISAGTYNFATNNPWIDATTPITEADISINYTTRVLTITPPLWYFNIFTDGNGIITRYRKVWTINFPAFTDTSGIWYFYFDSTGTAVTTQTPCDAGSFSTITTVYRLYWNATLSGSAKSVSELIETHLNTIPADDHTWKHIYWAIWGMWFDNKSTPLTTGTPNASWVNTCWSLTTGVAIDDNLTYTITNNTTGNKFTQDMGNITPASITVSNAGQFPIRYQDWAGLQYILPATRFPFSWNVATNRPEYITTTGVRTLVPWWDYFVYFAYVYQDPRGWQSVRLVSAPSNYWTITLARAITWTDIQWIYPTLNDNEIRPLYRCIYIYNSGWDAAIKYTRLYEIQDLRKAQVVSTSATGSLPASSVTVIPAGNIASTNVQSALEELDSEKLSTASKASWAEIDTGTDDAKFATAKALKDSHNVPSVAPWTSGNVLTSNGTDWTSAAPTGWSGWGNYMFAIAGTIWATGTNVSATHVANGNKTITSVDVWYGTAGSGTLTVDVNKNGTTIFATTKPWITTTNQVSINSWTLTTTALASGDILTIDIDAVPWTTAPVDLYVRVNYS